MQASDRLGGLTIKDDGFVFDPASGDVYVANPTALVILRTLHDGGDEAEAIAAVTARFDVDAEEARRDAADLFARLKSWQLT